MRKMSVLVGGTVSGGNDVVPLKGVLPKDLDTCFKVMGSIPTYSKGEILY